MHRDWSGVGTALVTPFTPGAIDEEALRRCRPADRTPASTFSCRAAPRARADANARRRDRIVEIVVEEPMAGAGAGRRRRLRHARGDRCSRARWRTPARQGFLSVTPYYNKPTQEGLYQHYRAIAESTPLPIIVYNVPGRTGVNVEPATLARLAQIPNIVGVKEASGNIAQMCEVCRAVPPDFLVLSGDDAMTLPLMAVGGRGLSRWRERGPDGMAQMVEAAEPATSRPRARSTRA